MPVDLAKANMPVSAGASGGMANSLPFRRQDIGSWATSSAGSVRHESPPLEREGRSAGGDRAERFRARSGSRNRWEIADREVPGRRRE